MTRKSLAIVAFFCTVAGLGASAAQGQGMGGNAAERFVLSGVILYQDGGGLAWLQEPSLTGDRTVALRLSDSIGPYRLTKILDDRVELQGPTGTVLVPVYNAPGGPGSAVGMSSSGSDPAGAPRAPQGRAAGGLSPSPQADPSGARAAVRDRLDMAKRHVEQLQNAGRMAGSTPAPQPGQVSAPEATIGRRGTGGGTQSTPSTVQGGNAQSNTPGAQSGTTSGQGAATPGAASPDVVIAPKGQTFQSILGLK